MQLTINDEVYTRFLTYVAKTGQQPSDALNNLLNMADALKTFENVMQM